MSERWWIVDAPAHRALERKMMPQTMMFGGEEVPVIGIVPPDDDWCCDFCNGSIEIRRTVQVEEVEKILPALVPMLSTNALCIECALRHGFPALWERPIAFCACEGCVAAVERMEGSQAL